MDFVGWMGGLLSLTSISVAGILVGVIITQKAYSHLRAVKSLFIGALISMMCLDIIIFARKFFSFSVALSVIAVRVTFSLILFAAAVMGLAMTILYCKPHSTEWKDIYIDVMRATFYPFMLYMIFIIVVFVLTWALPISFELISCPFKFEIYMPVLQAREWAIIFSTFVVFLVYPVAMFFFMSRAAVDEEVSQYLEMFTICLIGLAISTLLQPLFFYKCFPEAVDIIRIPILVVMVYIFKQLTVLESLSEIELKDYLEDLKRRARRDL